MRIRRGPTILMGVVIACTGATGMQAVKSERSDSADDGQLHSSAELTAPGAAMPNPAQYQQLHALSVARAMETRR